MARVINEHANLAMSRVVKYRRSNSYPYEVISAGVTTGYDSGKQSVNLTRADIVRTPKGQIRRPLPYTASGFNAGTVYLGMQVRRSTSAGESYLTDLDGLWGRILPPGLQNGLFDEAAIAETKVKILKRIGEQRWSLGESLVEMRDSVSTISKSATTLSRALMFAVRKDFKRMARELGVTDKDTRAIAARKRVAKATLGQKADQVADQWLAYHFAWKPIVSDMANAMIKLGGIDDWKDKILSLSASSHTTKESSAPFSYGPYTVNAHLSAAKATAYGTARHTALWKGRVNYKVTIASLRQLQQYGLVGLSTPWAVMPASYILDWIIPVGDYLAAIDATAGLTFDSGYETRYLRSELTDLTLQHNGTTAVGNGAVQRFSYDFIGVPHRFSLVRSRWSGLNPVFYWKDPLDLWKATTSLALFKRNAYGIRSSMGRS